MSKTRRRHPARATPAPAVSPQLTATLLRVAWLAIILGLVMEIIVVVLAVTLANAPSLDSFVADTAQKVTWSFFVCLGLAAGTAISRLQPAATGLAGLLAGPLAFLLARAAHRSAVQALALTRVTDLGSAPLYLVALKGIEYACLGLAIGWISRRPWGGLAAHLAMGLATGLVFGSIVLLMIVQNSPAPPSAAVLLAQGANEIIFPVGCAFVLFAAQSLARRAG
ncbi:MAG: hypothetical protein ACYC4L_20380 [Chloroflexota bacterium]